MNDYHCVSCKQDVKVVYEFDYHGKFFCPICSKHIGSVWSTDTDIFVGFTSKDSLIKGFK